MTIRFDPPGNPGRIPSRSTPAAPPHRQALTGDDGRAVFPRSDELDRLLQGRQRRSQPRTAPAPRHRPLEDFTAWSKSHGELPTIPCTTHTGLVHNGRSWVPQPCDCNLPLDYSKIPRDPAMSDDDRELRRIHSLLGHAHFTAPEPDDDLGEDQLHPIGTLAAALGRAPHTIRLWETKLGWLPDPGVRTAGEGRARKRKYTTAQIRGLKLIAEQEKLIDKDGTATSTRITDTDFTIRAFELFQHLDSQ